MVIDMDSDPPSPSKTNYESRSLANQKRAFGGLGEGVPGIKAYFKNKGGGVQGVVPQYTKCNSQ